MSEFKKALKDKSEKINQQLKKIMEQIHPSSVKLKEAMEYSLFCGGKRIRPVLTLMTAEMLAGDLESAAKAGAAIELIHTYSLVHDDLPAMDDDDYRRGKPSNHRVFGEAMAILAGDGLLTYCFNILANLDLPADKRLKIISLFSEKAGPVGMVDGQALDLEGEDKVLQLAELQLIHKKKTAALISASILAGAYCAEPVEVQIVALQDYAQKLGLLFQITDDILDVIGDQELLGKETGRDEQLNKATYPGLLGLKKTQNLARQLAVDAKNDLGIFEKKAAQLKALVDFVLKRNY